MRWQQFTGPIMAKGHEDTALYIYNRLVSVNDVGGDPAESVLPLEEFHARAQRRQALWPATLNATSTHDTKRSEDVRARINVISELAESWAARIDGWRRANERAKSVVRDQIVPYPNEEWLIYQTLAGVWPLDDAELPGLTERMQAYCQKAFREAKAHTSWVRPAEDYEAAVSAFVAAILTPGSDEQPNEFLKDFAPFRECVAYYGAFNALAQTLLKSTAPGVPDFYQGTELWDLSLVDPDNRRAVDYAVRARALECLGDAAPDELLEHWRDGRVKLHVTRTALATRAAQRELFTNGDYLPLEVAGEHAEHVIAFARRRADEWALVVVPRWLARLALLRHAPADGLPPCEPPLGQDVWGDTRVELPADAPRSWRNALTGETVLAGDEGLAVAVVFETLPVGLLAPTAS
jgi:(1->4)-alpha-D-glucan 1-alpha-D-glucosylmutase